MCKDTAMKLAKKVLYHGQIENIFKNAYEKEAINLTGTALSFDTRVSLRDGKVAKHEDDCPTHLDYIQASVL